MNIPNEQNDSVFYYLCRYDYNQFIEFYIMPKRERIRDRITNVQIKKIFYYGVLNIFFKRSFIFIFLMI